MICNEGLLLLILFDDLICEKGPLLKRLKTVLYINTCNEYLCIYSNCMDTKTVFRGVLTVLPFHKSGHKRFDRSDPLLQIM